MDREEIQKAVKEYLKRGGKIKKIEPQEIVIDTHYDVFDTFEVEEYDDLISSIRRNKKLMKTRNSRWAFAGVFQ